MIKGIYVSEYTSCCTHCIRAYNNSIPDIKVCQRCTNAEKDPITILGTPLRDGKLLCINRDGFFEQIPPCNIRVLGFINQNDSR